MSLRGVQRVVDLDVDADIDPEDIEAHQRWTFALNSDGDIRFNESTNTIATTHGQHAVKQSLLVAIATAKEEDPIDPEFGLDRFKATGSYPQLEREIRKTLIYDDYRHDRVDRVEDVQIIREYGSRHVRVQADVRIDTGDIDRLIFRVS